MRGDALSESEGEEMLQRRRRPKQTRIDSDLYQY
jgi:hypothetical protein